MIDSNGPLIIQLNQSTSSVIGNGRFHQDARIGEFTFHSLNGSSVVDYLILNIDDMQLVTDFCVLQPNEFSDHAGVTFSLHENRPITTQNKNTCNEGNIRWNDSKMDDLKHLVATKTREISQIERMINSDVNVELISNSLTNILQECVNYVCKRKNTHQNTRSQKHFNKKTWFNAECYNARSKFKKIRNLFLKDKKTISIKEIALLKVNQIIDDFSNSCITV